MAEENTNTTANTEQTNELDTLRAENERLKGENTKLRESVNSASADASKYKKQWQATLSEAERKEAEAAEQRKAEIAELEQLRMEKRVSGYTAKLMAVGYDAQTAGIMAAALPDGIGDAYFEAQRNFIDGKVQATKNELLSKQPTVTPGSAPAKEVAEAEAQKKLYSAFGL